MRPFNTKITQNKDEPKLDSKQEIWYPRRKIKVWLDQKVSINTPNLVSNGT